ncbi:small integral membrane protein 26 [Nematolebias whitei]|uniref:small integral membrane protein 26 n=1 Tax=Nematolebias whitei TaxID=451745 RepID=UPI0018988D99|nr:small integral membrane protein 26 [Nematolebias whitei]
MKIEDAMQWKTRGSIVYAVGIWTMIGTYGYLKYTGRLDNVKVEVEEVENTNKKVFQSKYGKTEIIRKENFVPYSTRIFRFITSFTGQTNAPQDYVSSSNDDGDASNTHVD